MAAIRDVVNDWGNTQVRGMYIRRGFIKPLTCRGKDMWEVRQKQHRILFCVHTERKQLVFLHGFKKQSDRTPQRFINTAARRMDEYISRLESRGRAP